MREWLGWVSWQGEKVMQTMACNRHRGMYASNTEGFSFHDISISIGAMYNTSCNVRQVSWEWNLLYRRSRCSSHRIVHPQACTVDRGTCTVTFSAWTVAPTSTSTVASCLLCRTATSNGHCTRVMAIDVFVSLVFKTKISFKLYNCIIECTVRV